MNEHEKLREQMWDLVYGLTSADETAALHARIKSDRAAARMYAEVRLESDLIAEAAKVEDTSVTLPQLSPRRERANAGRAKEASQTPAAKLGAAWSLHWLGAIGASALAVLMAVGIFWRQEQPPRQEVAQVLSVKAYRTTDLVRGLPQEFYLQASDSEGKPATVQILGEVVDSDGTPLYERLVETDERGRAQLPVPGDAIEGGNRLRVYGYENAGHKQVAQKVDGLAPVASTPEDSSLTASEDASRGAAPAPDGADRLDESERLVRLERRTKPLVEAQLDVLDEPVETTTAFDRTWYQPGDVIQWRTHARSAFTHQPVASVDLRLVGPDGLSLVPEETQAQKEAGVVTGKFRLPAEAPSGRYALRVQNPLHSEPQASAEIDVWRESDRALQRNKAKSEGLPEADVAKSELTEAVRTDAPAKAQQQPAPGAIKTPAPTTTRSSRGLAGGSQKPPGPLAEEAPLPLAPAAPASAALSAGEGRRKLDAAGTAAGTAAEFFAAGRDSLQSQGQLDAKAMLADASPSSKAASRTITIPIPPQLAGKPLLVEVRAHKLVISKHELPATEEAQDGTKAANAPVDEAPTRQAQIALPAPIDGEVDLYYFDRSSSPPRRIFATKLAIAPQNDFAIRLAEAPAKYAPGQTVRLKVQVTDHYGLAVKNAQLGLQVVPTLAMSTDGQAAAEEGAAVTRLFAGVRDKADGALPRLPASRAAEDAETEIVGGKSVAAGAPPKEPERSRGGAVQQPPKASGQAVSQSFAVPEGAADPAEPLPLQGVQEFREQADRFSGEGEPLTANYYDKQSEPHSALPTLLASNEDAVQSALDERRQADAAWQAQVAWWRARIGRGLLGGGVLLLVVLGIAVYLQRPASPRVWIPSLAVAAASFLVGFLWVLQQPRSALQSAAVVNSTEAKSELPLAKSEPDPAAVDRRQDLGLGATDDFTNGAPDSNVPLRDGPAGGFGGGGRPLDVLGRDAASKERLAGRLADGEADQSTVRKKAAEMNEAESAGESGIDPQKQVTAGQRFRQEGVAEAKGSLERQNGEKELSKSLGPAPAPAARRVLKSEGDRKDADPEPGQRFQDLAFDAGERGGKGSLAGVPGEAKKLRSNSIWQPLLVVDDNGEAVIEFTMPDEPGDYRLVLDALGPGQIGQLQQVIRSEAQPAPAAAGEVKP